jgi:hypothetical protein
MSLIPVDRGIGTGTRQLGFEGEKVEGGEEARRPGETWNALGRWEETWIELGGWWLQAWI